MSSAVYWRNQVKVCARNFQLFLLEKLNKVFFNTPTNFDCYLDLKIDSANKYRKRKNEPSRCAEMLY